jgi:predicted small metal-binding protein
MRYSLACADLGMIGCDYKARGKTQKEVTNKMKKHGKEFHGLTEEQLKDKSMAKMMRERMVKE